MKTKIQASAIMETTNKSVKIDGLLANRISPATEEPKVNNVITNLKEMRAKRKTIIKNRPVISKLNLIKLKFAIISGIVIFNLNPATRQNNKMLNQMAKKR